LWGEARRWYAPHVVLIGVHVANGVIGVDRRRGVVLGGVMGISWGTLAQPAVSYEMSHSSAMKAWPFGFLCRFVGETG
jgi:hypothetical protein